MTLTRICVVCFVSLSLCASAAHAAPEEVELEVGVEEEQEEIHAHEHEHEAHPTTERIVVTATPLEHSRDELAAPVDTLHRDDIVESLGTTLGETLSRTPGIATSGFARGASRPIIRGQDAYRTEVLEDGMPTQDVSRLSPDHGIPVNPLSARAIEIVRGPATLRYGGGAVGGVVNTLTNRVPTSTVEETESEIYSSFETNGNEGVVAARVDTGAGDFAFHFDGLYRNGDNFQTGGSHEGARTRTQPGSHTEAAAASIGTSWIGERGRLGVAYSHFNSTYGIPESGADIEVEMDTHRVRLEGELYDPLPGFTEVRLRSVYTDYDHDELEDGVVGQRFNNNAFEARLELLHEELFGFSGALGIDARYRDFSAGGHAAEFLAPTRTHSTAVYFFEERALLEWLHAELGGRFESTTLRGEPSPAGASRRTERFTPLSGSLGLVAHLSEEWTLGAVGAVSQRAPSQSELFARGVHEATGTFELGDPSLDEETAFTGELRLGHQGDRGRLDIATFVTRYNDYVFGNQTGVTVDDTGAPIAPGPNSFDELRYQARNALFYGGEVAADVDLFGCGNYELRADAQFDWVRAHFTSAGAGMRRNLPRITPIRWGGGISVEDDVTRARIGFLRTEGQSHLATSETSTGGFTMLDMSLIHTLMLGDGFELDLILRGTNLLDASARNHVAFNKDEVRLPGRSFRVGVQGRF